MNREQTTLVLALCFRLFTLNAGTHALRIALLTLAFCLALTVPLAQARQADGSRTSAGSAPADPTAAVDAASKDSPAPAATAAVATPHAKMKAAAAAADPPQATSPAGQFIFYGADGTSLSSSPVVTWDGVNMQMVFTPNITSGAQDFMDWVSPVGPQYCAGEPGEHQLELDIDGTYYFKGYCSGLRNEEIFDNQGNITFFGSTSGTLAGGWAVDYTNGDTCIVYINHDGTQPSNAGTCGDVATRFNNITGLVTQYAGMASASNPTGPASSGFPFILRSIDANQTGSVTNYPIYTTAASGYGGPGMYRLEAYIVEMAAAPNATMQFTVSYNDGQANQTLMSGPPVLFDTQGYFVNFSQPFYVTGNASVLVSTVTTNSPAYHAVLRLIAE
jgi:hypothetical protein